MPTPRSGSCTSSTRRGPVTPVNRGSGTGRLLLQQEAASLPLATPELRPAAAAREPSSLLETSSATGSRGRANSGGGSSEDCRANTRSRSRSSADDASIKSGVAGSLEVASGMAMAAFAVQLVATAAATRSGSTGDRKRAADVDAIDGQGDLAGNGMAVARLPGITQGASNCKQRKQEQEAAASSGGPVAS